jgi:hypothetical protein
MRPEKLFCENNDDAGVKSYDPQLLFHVQAVTTNLNVKLVFFSSTSTASK